MPEPPIDFSRRAAPHTLPEWMDGPCTYAEFRDCVRDIAATTRLTFSYWPVQHFLHRAVARRSAGAPPLRVLDVGSGGGDVLRHVARWASRRQLPLRLTGLDLNPWATRAARELSRGRPAFADIQWVTGDAFAHPEHQHPDVVLSSLMTHHLEDDEVVRFLRWMESHARVGWFLSDLVRSPRSYRLFATLSRLMRWHPFVQHDGLVSIRRGFREGDWERLLEAADIPREAVTLRRDGIGRLCLSRLR